MATTAWSPSVDIHETDNETVLNAELPGMELKDIDLKLENNVLCIRGHRLGRETKEENDHRVERAYDTFTRSFEIPTSVDNAHVRADYKDGILRVVLPKEEKTKPEGVETQAA